MKPPSDADCLRLPELVCDPDRRALDLVCFNLQTGAIRPMALTDQHAAIYQFVLNPAVPEDISIHFETARNLYLYAWFVYRFYPIAEQQALATLEFALRERLSEFVECEKKRNKGRSPTLRKLLERAIKQQIIRNEAFTGRESWALKSARFQHDVEQMRKMQDAKLETIVVDESRVQPSEQDLEHDWLRAFLKCLPKIRNDYAHGSSTLHPNVLRTFEVVMEIINQLYPGNPSPSDGLPCTDHEP